MIYDYAKSAPARPGKAALIAGLIGLLATAAFAQSDADIPLEAPTVSFGDPSVENLTTQPQPTYAETSAASEDLAERDEGQVHDLILFLTVFVLAIVVGVEVITKVPPTLHTPLMSGSNAISGITIIGAILAGASQDGSYLAGALAVLAAIFAMINVVGGFAVTDRMLKMFRKKGRA